LLHSWNSGLFVDCIELLEKGKLSCSLIQFHNYHLVLVTVKDSLKTVLVVIKLPLHEVRAGWIPPQATNYCF